MNNLIQCNIASLTLVSTCAAYAQTPAALKSNQTAGYAQGNVLPFNLDPEFACVEQPGDDLAFNKIPAARDPSETQTPI
jgi:hypothetical protein